MRILMHVCCGPCSVFPVQELRAHGHEVNGYFYNPNIHPYREFKRRITALSQFAEQTNFPVVIERTYGLTEYLRQVVFHEDTRCSICYAIRLEKTAKKAAKEGMDAFTSTLFYSKYQNHNLLIRQCEKLSKTYEIPFFYQDFRLGWQEGIDGSLAMDLYRQPYCGCIYSEQERYDKKMRKKMGRDSGN